ncbi:MAG: C4-dicarboxylate ABC transporter substrate-binding protein [Methylocapsa sp.]|nr:C4-dicarboxylate ABC transporter substrate-binding protein [Methylocapsa sp.]
MHAWRTGTNAVLMALLIAVSAGVFFIPAFAQTSAPEATGALEKIKLPIKAQPPQGSNTLGLLADSQNESDVSAAKDIAALIATGQETGPNDEQALRIAPIPGSGGFESIRGLLAVADADLSIVPVPLLERAPAALGVDDLRKRIVYIAPLFEEDFRLLANPSIRNIYDLAGKTVNLGAKDSASDVLGRSMFENFGLDINPVNLADADPINAIANGEIEADLALGDRPRETLAKQRPRYNLRLVTIPRLHALAKDYLSAALTSADDPDLIPPGARVETLGVRSVLIAYNWPKGSHRYNLMTFFVRTLFSRFLELQNGTHDPKWLEVNFDAGVPGWPQFPPARRWLDQKGIGSAPSR